MLASPFYRPPGLEFGHAWAMDSNRRSRGFGDETTRRQGNGVGQEISGSSAVSGGGSPERPDSAEEPQGRIARWVKRRVEHPRPGSVARWRDGSERSHICEIIGNGIGAAGIPGHYPASLDVFQRRFDFGADGGRSGRPARGLRPPTSVRNRRVPGAHSAPACDDTRATVAEIMEPLCELSGNNGETIVSIQ